MRVKPWRYLTMNERLRVKIAMTRIWMNPVKFVKALS